MISVFNNCYLKAIQLQHENIRLIQTDILDYSILKRLILLLISHNWYQCLRAYSFMALFYQRRIGEHWSPRFDCRYIYDCLVSHHDILRVRGT